MPSYSALGARSTCSPAHKPAHRGATQLHHLKPQPRCHSISIRGRLSLSCSQKGEGLERLHKKVRKAETKHKEALSKLKAKLAEESVDTTLYEEFLRRQTPPNLVIIGGRGCGKSSVSRRLASADKRFERLCLDTLIRYEAYGQPISDIVAERQWTGFRDLEHEVVCKALSFQEWMLIDAGGGVVVDLDAEGNEIFSERKVQVLRDNAFVVYLKRPVEYLMQRIEKKEREQLAATAGAEGDTNRPALSATRSFEEIMERRGPWYEQAADWVFDCDGLSKAQIAQEILEVYMKRVESAVQP